MSRRFSRGLLGVLGLTVLAMPGVANAATKSVDMGLPLAQQKSFNNNAVDVNDFFPHQVTVHVGDTVRFVPVGFHTVDLPARRTAKLAPIVPTGQPVAGSLDAAGAPFWFNGQPAVGFNPKLLSSAFGKRRTYTGSREVLSGLPLSNRPGAMSVKFTKAGNFRYFCDIHLGMTGRVAVVASSRRVPTAAGDARALKRQIAAARKVAGTLRRATPPPANTVDVGRQGSGGVSLFAFVPNRLTVAAGTTVVFRMGARSEIHTATTGPGDPERQPDSYLGQIAASLNSPAFDPKALYPSDVPGSLAALSPLLHGNGFWSSGVLDLELGTPPPTRNAVNFAAPGTYQVYCMIHPFMHGTVTVQ